jgi:hypothetical protein
VLRRVVGGVGFLGAAVALLLAPARAAPAPLGRADALLPPEIVVTITGQLGSNAWYRSNVTVDWQVTGETSSSGCDTVTLAADTAGTKLTCTAESNGDETTKSVTIKVDKTPPTASAAADRPPDANGWYNQPLTVSSSGADAMSGLGSCSSTAYAGPDDASASVAGSCQDAAGNTKATSLAFRYDATAPKLRYLKTRPRDHAVQLEWTNSGDMRVVNVVRTPGRNGAAQSLVFSGLAHRFRDRRVTVGRAYAYRVSGLDRANNVAERVVTAVATGALLRPAPGKELARNARPKLLWADVKGASYYNVQLYRNGKILSVWPVRHSFQLRREWRYKGRRYRLGPGVYRWFVWPGFGRIAAASYGRLVGQSTFVVSD